MSDATPQPDKRAEALEDGDWQLEIRAFNAAGTAPTEELRTLIKDLWAAYCSALTPAQDAGRVEDNKLLCGFDYGSENGDLSCLTISEVIDGKIFVRSCLYGDDALYVQKALEQAALHPHIFKGE